MKMKLRWRMRVQSLPSNSAYVGPQPPLRPTPFSQLVQAAMILPTKLMFALGIATAVISMEEHNPRMKFVLVIVPL